MGLMVTLLATWPGVLGALMAVVGWFMTCYLSGRSTECHALLLRVGAKLDFHTVFYFALRAEEKLWTIFMKQEGKPKNARFYTGDTFQDSVKNLLTYRDWTEFTFLPQTRKLRDLLRDNRHLAFIPAGQHEPTCLLELCMSVDSYEALLPAWQAERQELQQQNPNQMLTRRTSTNMGAVNFPAEDLIQYAADSVDSLTEQKNAISKRLADKTRLLPALPQVWESPSSGQLQGDALV